jgi:hypothetical protein
MGMILNITRLHRASDRTWNSLIGVSQKEFYTLLPLFSSAWYTYLATKPNRKRKPGAGIKGVLPGDIEKLFFALMYLKTYPTFDVMGFMWGTDKTRAHKWIQKLLPILRNSLHISGNLPKRKIASVEEFMELFPEVKDVFVDGTERPVQKPKNQKKRKKLYSGKKKGTRRKNIVVNDEKRRILFLSPTRSGRRHDKRLADKDHLPRGIPDNVTAWTDTGFVGWGRGHPNIIMPKKRTKNHPLTEEEREENRVISSIRVISEHAIGGIKRLKAASDIYRNRILNMDDLFMELSAGIWNFHLAQG